MLHSQIDLVKLLAADAVSVQDVEDWCTVAWLQEAFNAWRKQTSEPGITRVIDDGAAVQPPQGLTVDESLENVQYVAKKWTVKTRKNSKTFEPRGSTSSGISFEEEKLDRAAMARNLSISDAAVEEASVPFPVHRSESRASHTFQVAYERGARSAHALGAGLKMGLNMVKGLGTKVGGVAADVVLGGLKKVHGYADGDSESEASEDESNLDASGNILRQESDQYVANSAIVGGDGNFGT